MVKIVRRHQILDELQDNSSVLTLFARAGDLFKSTDSKDLIYALIGFLNPGVEIKPDYALGSKTYSVPQLAHSLRVLGILISLLTLGAYLTPKMTFRLGVRIGPDLF
jgi:hypothetical protein